MRKIQYILYVAFVALFFTACQEDDFGGAEQGGIRIALADGTTGVDVTTRSTPSELFDGFKKKFKFQIKGGDNYDQTHEWTEDVIPLAAGVYEIIATCGTEQAAGVVEFDKPCYTGKAEGIKVEVGKEAKAEVKCKVTNALVSIQFDEENKAFAEDAGAIIAVGGTDEIWGDLSKSAYFKAGSSLTKLIINRGNDVSNEADILEEVKKNHNFPKAFEAGDHLIITLSVAKKDGNVAIKVSKVELKEVTIEETIPMEWLPKPKMEVEGFDATTKMLSMYESETPTAKFNFDLSSGLQELKFTLNFADEEYKSLNKAYTLSELSQEDKTALTNAGVVLPSIGDKGNVSLDFSGLTAKLTGSTEGGALDNVIKLTEVKANNRVLEGGEQTYTIQTYAPEFDIKVYPGNTWTKQFTANTEITKGNAKVIREGMTFEYKTNGSDWTSSKDSLIAGLTPGTDYQVRAKFGKHITEVTKVSTYPVIDLENGNMEEWKEEERGYYYDANIFNSNDPKLRVYYPWDSESFWNTNNNFTTRNRDASTAAFSIVYRYNSFPAVSYTKDANSGTWAAELRNTAAGRGNTSSSKSSYDFNNVPGELFIGDISVSEGGTEVIPNDSYSINKGKAFASRPTALRFYYKYAPYNTDSWKVYIALYDSENNIIAENTKTGGKQDSYEFIDVSFNYIDDLNAVPAKIYVYFASSIYSGSQLPYHKMNVTTWYKDSQRTDETLSGSVFTIDDISLIYDK